MKRLKWHVFFLVLGALGTCGLLSGCIGESEQDETREFVQVGDSVPDFVVRLSDTTEFHSRNATQQVAVVVFFDTTCRDCQQFLPRLQHVYHEFRDSENHSAIDVKPSVRFVAIARSQTKEIVADYWKQQALDLPFAALGHRDLYERFATRVIPRVYVVSPKGLVVAKFDDNPIATEEQLRVAIRRAMEL